jgi:hypothetical protein
MKDDAIRIILVTIILVALGIAGIGLYMYIDELIKGFFIS